MGKCVIRAYKKVSDPNEEPFARVSVDADDTEGYRQVVKDLEAAGMKSFTVHFEGAV